MSEDSDVFKEPKPKPAVENRENGVEVRDAIHFGLGLIVGVVLICFIWAIRDKASDDKAQLRKALKELKQAEFSAELENELLREYQQALKKAEKRIRELKNSR